VGYTLLLECDAPGTGKGATMKKKIIKIIIISIIKNYSPRGVHQAILPSAHTPLAGNRTPHLNCSTSAVLPPSLLRGPLPLLISCGDFLALGPRNLGSFSPLQ